MKNNNFKQYNAQALKDLNKVLNSTQKGAINIKINIDEYWELMEMIETILETIEFIGFNGSENELTKVGILAKTARKLLPINECNFLDNLLIKESANSSINTNFVNIN
jgi:hypothetical protein